MRPSSLGGGRILRRTLSVRLTVCLSVCLSVRPVIVAIGNVFSSTASVTDVLFGTLWGLHIVRPSRPHQFLFNTLIPRLHQRSVRPSRLNTGNVWVATRYTTADSVVYIRALECSRGIIPHYQWFYGYIQLNTDYNIGSKSISTSLSSCIR